MAISIDWPTGVITVPRADMALVQTDPFEIRDLDLEVFRKALRSLEDSEDGRVFPITHSYSPQTQLGGTTFAGQVNILSEYYSVTFEDGQYAVNLIGANSNVSDVANLNQVSIRPQNSAGLIAVDELRRSLKALSDTVYYDSVNGVAGTFSGVGLPDNPSNNLLDVLAIAARDSQRRMQIRSALTVDEDMPGFTVISDGTAHYLVLTGTNVAQMAAQDLIVTGAQSGLTRYFNCTIGQLTGFYGQMRSCGLVQSPVAQASPTLTLQPDQDSRLIDCFESDPTGSWPVIDISQGAITKLTVQGYRGLLGLQGLDATAKRAEINLAGGQLILDSSCTDGVVVLSGYGGEVALNGATTTIDTSNYISPASGSGAFTNADRLNLDNLSATLESSGVFSTAALVNSPAGGGGSGDANLANQQAMLELLRADEIKLGDRFYKTVSGSGASGTPIYDKDVTVSNNGENVTLTEALSPDEQKGRLHALFII
ncbi:MAG: hypothetical protein AAFV72_00310 [Cyanobacteria bacterium J06635_1]